MNRLPVSRIGEVQSLAPKRLYVGASATDEQLARVLADAVDTGRPVRVLVDPETIPTLELMVKVSAIAAAGDLEASWVLNLPHSVDVTVHHLVAPDLSNGTHGCVPDATGEDGAPTPAPDGVGTTLTNTEEVAP